MSEKWERFGLALLFAGVAVIGLLLAKEINTPTHSARSPLEASPRGLH